MASMEFERADVCVFEFVSIFMLFDHGHWAESKTSLTVVQRLRVRSSPKRDWEWPFSFLIHYRSTSAVTRTQHRYTHSMHKQTGVSCHSGGPLL